MHTATKIITNEDILKAVAQLGDRLNQEIDGLAESLKDFMQDTGKAFQKVDEHFRDVDGRFKKIDECFKEVDGRFTRIEIDFKQVDAHLSRLDESFSKLDARAEKIEYRMLKMHMDATSSRTRQQSIEIQLSELKRMVEKLLGKDRESDKEIAHVLKRLTALEARLPKITELEIRELERLLQLVVEWAVKAASKVDIGLTLPT